MPNNSCSFKDLQHLQNHVGIEWSIIRILRTRLIIEPKQFPVHGLVVKPEVKPQPNWWCHKEMIYILLNLKQF